MPLYRILKPLSLKGGRLNSGGLASLKMDDAALAILEQREAISRLYTPPIAEIPGWELKAKVLADTPIITVEDFLEAQDETLAEYLGLQPGEIPRLKQILESYLFVPGPMPCGCS